jgi:hypothetical protein
MVKISQKEKLVDDINNYLLKMGGFEITAEEYDNATVASLKDLLKDAKNEYKIYRNKGNADHLPTDNINTVVNTRQRQQQQLIIDQQQAFEDAYLEKKKKEQERIDKLKLDLFANSAVQQVKNADGQWVEAPIEYLPELKLSRSLTRAGAYMTGIDRRSRVGEWTVEELRKYKIPLRR